jgi:hypothetical protein
MQSLLVRIRVFDGYFMVIRDVSTVPVARISSRSSAGSQ